MLGAICILKRPTHLKFVSIASAIGKPNQRLPYSQRASLDVRGLPAGIDLKLPSSYCLQDLHSIIAVSNDIIITGKPDLPEQLGILAYLPIYSYTISFFLLLLDSLTNGN